MTALLNGINEQPPVNTAAEGTASVEIGEDQLAVTLTTQLLTNVLAAHIHCAPPGVNGPVIFGLYDSGTDGPFASPLMRELSAADLQPAPGITTFDEARSAILAGQCYVNVHTVAQPNGEIRGQLGAFEVHALLRGINEVPPVDSAAIGRASLGVTASAITTTLNTGGLVDVIAAHIHCAPPGVNGPVVFGLYATGDGTFTTSFTRVSTATDLIPSGSLITFAAAAEAILTGDCYVNVHTMAHTGGEIRGQIGAVELHTALSGDSEVPPVTTAASGRLSLGITESRILATLRTADLNDATAAHIHLGTSDINGPAIFQLFDSNDDGALSSPWTRSLTASDLQPAPPVSDFGQALAAIIAGATYVNVHTVDHPDGEIRGQITVE
jgi:hypothetical protein